MKSKDLLELVNELNESLGDYCVENEYQFNLTTSGFVNIISIYLFDFGGDIILWNSEDDDVCNYFDIYPYGKIVFKDFLSLKIKKISKSISNLSDVTGSISL